MDHRCYVNIDMRQIQPVASLGSPPGDGITTCVNVSPLAIRHPGAIPDRSDSTSGCGFRERRSKSGVRLLLVSPRPTTRDLELQSCAHIRGREQLIKARDVASRCSPRCWEAAALTPLAIPRESLAGRSSDRPDTSERDCQVSTLSNKNCS